MEKNIVLTDSVGHGYNATANVDKLNRIIDVKIYQNFSSCFESILNERMRGRQFDSVDENNQIFNEVILLAGEFDSTRERKY